jgi:hypothetical protein
MGYKHTITLPGANAGVAKRIVEIVDGDEKNYFTLGRSDTLIDYTATNSNISYSYIEYDSNNSPIAAETVVNDTPEPPAPPEIAPEAPTNVLPPDPPVIVEGDVVVAPHTDL